MNNTATSLETQHEFKLRHYLTNLHLNSFTLKTFSHNLNKTFSKSISFFLSDTGKVKTPDNTINVGHNIMNVTWENEVFRKIHIHKMLSIHRGMLSTGLLI